jgi:hypothetical protein
MVYFLKGKDIANPLWVIRRYTMETYKQLSHTTYLCNYHVVFCPKYRFRILYGVVGQKVRDWVRKIAEWKGVDILEGHVSKDHVHLVLSIPPKYAVSDVVGTTSRAASPSGYLSMCRRYAKSIGTVDSGPRATS